MSRRFVSEHAGAYPVTRLCELVGVPRSSYYEWACRPLSEHYLDDVDLANEIFDIMWRPAAPMGRRACWPAAQPRPASRLQARGADHVGMWPGRRARPEEVAAREA